MNETIAIFLGLAIFFLLLAALGHGIWLVTAMIFRGLFGKRCGTCGERFYAATCNCHLFRSSHLVDPRIANGGQGPSIHEDLEAAKRLIEFTKFHRWLDDEQIQKLEQLIQRLRARATENQPSAGLTPPQQSSQPTIDLASIESDRVTDSLAIPVASIVDTPLHSSPNLPIGTEESLHPLDRVYESPETGPRRAPIQQRLTANLLKSFMEQSNIRWVELISAALIVICSVGLVISLWSTLSSTSRFFPSLVFLAATLAVHGAGQYTLKQWKLRSTSRGILHIGLMLIPLATLVGILLSRRPGVASAIDLYVASVIGIGTLVYATLAVTASRSLFARLWPIAANMVIVSGLTLLPIHYLGERQQLQQLTSTWFLIPLLIASMCSAYFMSRSSIRLGPNSKGVRRVAGIVTQSLFAILIPTIFWYLQARREGGVGGGWWVATGILAMTWGSWGWSVSLRSTPTSNPIVTPVSRSWLNVVAWVLASVLSIFWMAAIWQSGSNRIAVTILLSVSAGWWLFQGWRWNLRPGIIAGGIALMTSLTLLLEGFIESNGAIRMVDWIGLTRISILTTIGIASAMITYLVQRLSLGDALRSAEPFRNKSRPATFQETLQPLQFSGAIVVFAAAILTVCASLLPIGETPYGGNWAALLLITYGLLAMVAGVVHRSSGTHFQWSKTILPIGQAILLLGTVRLCQTSPLLEDLLADLRPARSWSIGTAILSLGWSLLAALLKVRDDRKGIATSESQSSNIRWLTLSASFLGVLSVIAIWSNPDHLRLAGNIGWFLPLGCLAIFLSQRTGSWRELSLIGLCLWTCSLAYAIGDRNDWWPTLGFACSVSILVLVSMASLAIFEQSLHLIQRTMDRLKSNVEDQPRQSWSNDGIHWASPTLLLSGWVALLLALLCPFVPNLFHSLSIVADFDRFPFAFAPLQNLGFGLVIATGIALTAISAWIGVRKQQALLLDSIALLPAVVAFAVGSWIELPYSFSASLWSLSVLLMGSDLLQFAGQNWKDRSLQSWQRLVIPQGKVTRSIQWLPLGRGLAVALLSIGTIVMIASLISGRLASEFVLDGSGGINTTTLVLALGPALIFGLTRWLFALANGEQPQVTFATALLTSVVGGFIAALTVSSGLPQSSLLTRETWPSLTIALLQAFGSIATSLALIALLFTGARNAIGLRKVFGSKLGMVELCSKGMKGARWQRSEKSSWSIVTVALGLVALLSAGASFVVLSFPVQRLNGVEQLGGLPVLMTAIMTLLLFWFLFARRGASHFGMLATTLGLLSPLGAASYMNWLIADPTRSNPAALDFEPVRMIVLLWIVALAIGLAFRFLSAAKGRTVSRIGEIGWVLLAIVVGCLGLVSTTQDPDARWPFFELSALAFITVLSSLASRQVWRGHLAPIAAAAGCFAWLIHHAGQIEMQHFWNILWGPIWVAILASLSRILLERTKFGVYHESTETSQAPLLTVDRSVSLLVPIVSGLFSFLWIRFDGSPIAITSGLAWSILGLAVASLLLGIMRLWETHPGKRGLAFYVNLISCGLVFAAVLSTHAELPSMQIWLIWLASGLGAMAIIAGLLREMIREGSMLGPTLKFGSITEPMRLQQALHWMPTVHSIASLLALVPCILLVLAFEERSMRVAATILPFIGALSILPIATEKGKDLFRYVGLSLISSTLVLLWWADLPSAWTVVDLDGAWIFVHRAFVALVLLGILYPFIADRFQQKEEWNRPLMNMGWISFGLGLLTGAVMLLGEMAKVWNVAAVDASLGTKGMTIVAWIAVTARLLQFAVRPLPTERSASEESRKLAVYASELALAFLCGSCYFHFPDLFGGIFLKWWPLVVFGIAMLSTGLGEWLKRMDQRIVADPVCRSSLLLPILPLVGVWWFHPDGAEWLWSDWGRYSFLLLSASILYGVQSSIHNSIRLRGLASLLILFSFWAFLQSSSDLQFMQHPQFWILPPALAGLCFVEFNRKQLHPNVVVASRYIVVLIAYLSSSAEVFLKAFEGQLWQPLLLLILALAGIAAGIVMRVRAFLYCGVAFTLIALLGMVWHAQQAIGQVWPWWAFGIATGVGLIVMLGYFEKNRPKVFAYLEQFKKWEQ